MGKIKVAGIRQVPNLSQIEVLSLPIRLYGPDKILTRLAENRINLEFIVAHGRLDETMDLILGVNRNHIAAALGLLRAMGGYYRLEEIRSRDGVAMVSLFPHGNRPAVMGNFLSAFQDAGVRLLSVTLSLAAISGLIDEHLLPDALSALGDYFALPG